MLAIFITHNRFTLTLLYYKKTYKFLKFRDYLKSAITLQAGLYMLIHMNTFQGQFKHIT